MTLRFIDTNIFIRHLTNDDPKQSPACFALIQAIEQGKRSAWTSELVISELVFVLSKVYKLNRESIRELLLPLIQLPGLKLTHKQLYRNVFELYTTHPIDYVDAYHMALMENRKTPELYSYDTDFDKIKGIQRFEP